MVKTEERLVLQHLRSQVSWEMGRFGLGRLDRKKTSVYLKTSALAEPPVMTQPYVMNPNPAHLPTPPPVIKPRYLLLRPPT